MDWELISRIHNLFLFCGETQGVASRHACITQMTMFPHHAAASAVTGTAVEHCTGPLARGAISHNLWTLPGNNSLSECQHEPESHQASSYTVQKINYLDERL